MLQSEQSCDSEMNMYDRDSRIDFRICEDEFLSQCDITKSKRLIHKLAKTLKEHPGDLTVVRVVNYCG